MIKRKIVKRMRNSLLGHNNEARVFAKVDGIRQFNLLPLIILFIILENHESLVIMLLSSDDPQLVLERDHRQVVDDAAERGRKWHVFFIVLIIFEHLIC